MGSSIKFSSINGNRITTRVILFHENKTIKLDDDNILEEVKSPVIIMLRLRKL